MPTSSVVDVGGGVVIERSVIHASRKHASTPVVADFTWVVVQGAGIRTVLGPAMGIGGGLLGHHDSQHLLQTPGR